LAVDTKGSKTTVQGDAKVIPVDYNNKTSIKYALTGVDVVISTVPMTVLDVQEKIAAAAKEVDVKLFVPSEYGGVTDGETEGIPGAKANVQGQLKALGMPYAAFYTGPWADFAWKSYVSLNTSFLAIPSS
jgi:NmrA-like family